MRILEYWIQERLRRTPPGQPRRRHRREALLRPRVPISPRRAQAHLLKTRLVLPHPHSPHLTQNVKIPKLKNHPQTSSPESSPFETDWLPDVEANTRRPSLEDPDWKTGRRDSGLGTVHYAGAVLVVGLELWNCRIGNAGTRTGCCLSRNRSRRRARRYQDDYNCTVPAPYCIVSCIVPVNGRNTRTRGIASIHEYECWYHGAIILLYFTDQAFGLEGF